LQPLQQLPVYLWSLLCEVSKVCRLTIRRSQRRLALAVPLRGQRHESGVAQLSTLGIKPVPIFWPWFFTELFAGSEAAGEATTGLFGFGLSW
jgi:hypothetical protein